MTKEEAIRILDEVIPPPEHHTVDLDHLPIAQAWACIKEMLIAEPFNCSLEEFGECSYRETGCSDCKVKEKVRNAIDNTDTVRHGHWVDVEPAPWGQVYETCSECRIRQALDKGKDKFCGVCGAKMDLHEVEECQQEMK